MELKGEHKRQSHGFAVRSAVHEALSKITTYCAPYGGQTSAVIPAKIEIEVKTLEGQYIAYLKVTETINPDDIKP